VLQKCGRAVEAVSDFRQSITRLRGLTAPSSEDYYNIVCAQSLLSGIAAEADSGPTADEGQAEADHSMATLRHAIASGWRDWARIRTNSDLNPIQSRPESLLLMVDLAMPNDPFARGD
jgi:hypothetical protein